MTPIVPSTTVLVPTVAAGQTAPTPVAPVAPVAGTILSAGAAVTQMQAGAFLRGTVTGRNEAGQLIVDTPRGRIVLAAQANMAPGSEVVLQVKSGGQRPQVTLLQVMPDGHAPPRPAGTPTPQHPASAQAGASTTSGASTPAPPIAQSQVTGFTTTAVVVAARQPLPGQPPGQLPGPQPAGQPASHPAGQPAATAPTPAGTPAPAAAATPAGAPPLPSLETGTTLGLRINAVLAPGQEPQPGTAQAAMQRGVITVLTASGHPIVQTQAGLLLLGTKMAAPVGATVLMEVAPGWTEEPAAAAATADPRPPATGPRPDAKQPFPALAQALAVLRHAGQPVPESTVKHLPHVGTRLAEGLIAAATGARAEHLAALEALLRPALEQAGHKELADALRQELGRLAGSPAASAEAEWRLTVMPLLDEGQLHQLRLYERNHRGGNGGRQGDGHSGTRFVVEVEMSQLGPIQLDGLVQPGRLDVMLRSKLALSPSMRRDISAIYEEARALAGFAGEIGFQQTAVFPVDPSVAAGHAGVVV